MMGAREQGGEEEKWVTWSWNGDDEQVEEVEVGDETG